MLSTMVLMGINRIVVTGGKIRATMGFHIDTSDSAFERTAEDIDARVAARGHYGMGFWGVEASASLAYVSSKRAGSGRLRRFVVTVTPMAFPVRVGLGKNTADLP